MILHRNTFFLLLAVLYVGVIASPRLVWLARSEKATGIFAFQGRGNALELLPESASFIYYMYGKDTSWFKALGGLGLPENTPIAVRFHKDDPQSALIDSWRDIWLPTMVYGALPMLVLIVAFIHPHIIPWKSKVIIVRRRPFVKLIT